MDLARLQRLKQKMANAKDLSTIFDYFLDHFGEDPAFLKIGKPTEHRELEAFLAAVGEQLVGGKRCTVSKTLLLAIPEGKFIHGTCRINGSPANVLYFEDIYVGLLALLPTRPDGKTQLGRFSCRHLPPTAVPSKN